MQVRAMAASVSRRVDILREKTSVFGDVAVFVKCFWTFILPVLEYVLHFWMSATTSQLLLLDPVVGRVSQLSSESVSCDLGWSPCACSFSCTVRVEETNPWSFSCSLSIFRDAMVYNWSAFAPFCCLVFDCGMGCMNLSLLVNVWVLLKLQSIAFFYKIDCPLLLPVVRVFHFHIIFFSFSSFTEGRRVSAALLLSLIQDE